AAPGRWAGVRRRGEEVAAPPVTSSAPPGGRAGFSFPGGGGAGGGASLWPGAASHFLTPHGASSLLKVPAQGAGATCLARPGEVARRLNAQFAVGRSEQFLTLFYGVVDLDTCTLTYANAGHPGPVLLAEGAAPSVLPGSGLPIGVLEEAEYGDADVRLRPGERLWLYSDGLVEAMNPAGQQFGLGRLVAELRAASAGALSDGLRTVLR